MFFSLVVGFSAFGIYNLRKSKVDKYDIFYNYISNNCNRYTGHMRISYDDINIDNFYYNKQQNTLNNILSQDFSNIKELRAVLNNMYKNDYLNDRYTLLNNWILSDTESLICYLTLIENKK